MSAERPVEARMSDLGSEGIFGDVIAVGVVDGEARRARTAPVIRPITAPVWKPRWATWVVRIAVAFSWSSAWVA